MVFLDINIISALKLAFIYERLVVEIPAARASGLQEIDGLQEEILSH